MVEYGPSTSGTDRHPLDCFFAPRAVAVIGASERAQSVGRTMFWNLISSPFGGTVYAVNPHHSRVLGIRTLNSIQDAPEPVDLALIVTPAPTVPQMLDACIDAGVQGAIIISADFTEQGLPSPALVDDIRLRTASRSIRVIGPNSLGLMNPVLGLNAAYATQLALRGSVGFISQSGALSAAVLDWSLRVNMGFSAFVSFGAMVDVSWGDLIYYLGSDRHTKSIVIYMESLGDARSFLSAAREVALTKPIILLKTSGGHTDTGTIRGSGYIDTADTADDAVLSAALLRSGVLRVDDIETLFSMADVLGKQPRPRGPRLTVISNAAGPAVLAADAVSRAGGHIARLSGDTVSRLDAILPPYWNRANPVDIMADASPERYAKAVECAVDDAESDAVLVVLAPQVATKPTDVARAIAALERKDGKPLLAAWMGGDMVGEGTEILQACRIPTFPYPDQAARIFAAMWRYSYAVRGLYETPEPAFGDKELIAARAEVSAMVARARELGRDRLTDEQTKSLLTAYGIPVAETRVVHSADEAVAQAAELGYPVTLRPNCPAIHDAAFVRTHVAAQINDEEVRRRFTELAASLPDTARHGVMLRPYVRETGYQLILASRIDPQFGPCLFFRAGGHTGGLLRDEACSLPPLNTTLARRTMERTRIYEALAGRSAAPAVNLHALERVLVAFSNLVIAERGIREIEIHPLMAAGDRILALEARATLHDQSTPMDRIPRLAIRPYPVEYSRECLLKDGERVLLRPIRPEDEVLMVKFHKTLSSDTVYFRYLRLLSLDQRIRHDRMSQMCFIDYDRQIGLVAECAHSETGEKSILAIARLVRIHASAAADFAIVVSDRAQGRGLGGQLMRHLLDVARAEKISPVTGLIHPENRSMLRLCRSLGFALVKSPGEEVCAEIRPERAYS